jgi:hypothetical protein
MSFLRAYGVRKNNFPIILYIAKTILSDNVKLSGYYSDGRLNSNDDEKIISDKLCYYIDNTCILKAKERMWYDILLFDVTHGWIPINIKTTLGTSHDNIGNLSLCLYSYTNYEMRFDKNYSNGQIYKILINKLKNAEINLSLRNYYFLVVIKNTNVVIVNSMLSLSKLTPNLNNLPFQICWNNNKIIDKIDVHEQIKRFLHCIKQPKNNWRELFINSIKNIDY